MPGARNIRLGDSRDLLGAQVNGARIMCVGDSITEGGAATDGAGYRSQFASALNALGYSYTLVGPNTTGTVANPPSNAHAGYSSRPISAFVPGGSVQWPYEINLKTLISTYAPTHLLLHIGTNDVVLGGLTASQSVTLLSTLLDTETTGYLPTLQVLVASMIPSPNGTYNTGIAAINALIPAAVASLRAANRKVTHVAAMATALNTGTDYNADNIHPNDAGFVKMAATWASALRAMP